MCKSESDENPQSHSKNPRNILIHVVGSSETKNLQKLRNAEEWRVPYRPVPSSIHYTL